ncbi:hypothetical protein CDS [Bradyrhizobium sp.]|nr:hypothetical protein CDS [Bradyrhizobium sp.]
MAACATIVGWAKAQSAVPTFFVCDREWWARLRFAHPTRPIAPRPSRSPRPQMT